ncbi:rho family protein [Apiospora rasikravindrae]|uniref:Rho family protein n=1 Tax=Apiospora rasikravindrae TaxID=990691 RepID=A0ABR1RSX7_9PEZI
MAEFSFFTSTLSEDFGFKPSPARDTTNVQKSPKQEPQYHPPIAKDFSFSLQNIWRSNNNVLKWAFDIPEVAREDPIETSDALREKRCLSSNEYQAGHDGGQHRNKRTKHHQSIHNHQHPVKQRRRDRFLQTTRNIAGSILDGINCSMNPFRDFSSELDGSTVQGSATPPGTPVNFVPSRPHLRFVFVGDQYCGKSSMLFRFCRGIFNDTWTPTKYEMYEQPVMMDDQLIDMELWDTSGKLELHQLSRLSYMSWDAVFICFSVNSDKKFTHAQGRGAMAATGMGAVKYLECSAKTGDGVNRVFEESLRHLQTTRHDLGNPEPSKGSGLRQLLCFQ